MRLPETVSGAGRVILLALAAVLGLLLVAGVAAPVVMPDEDDCAPSVVELPDCVVEAEVGKVRERDPARGVPLRLVVPAIGVEAPVVPVALGASGVLEPPADVTRVGWWEGGAEPGSRHGTVLLTGHNYSRGDGVFDDLQRMRAGDLLEVWTTRGRVRYRVDAVEDYTKTQLSRIATGLFSQSVRSQLVLVTCSNYEHGVFHGNTVVIAHPSGTSRRYVD